jgi:hypothetical protein
MNSNTNWYNCVICQSVNNDEPVSCPADSPIAPLSYKTQSYKTFLDSWAKLRSAGIDVWVAGLGEDATCEMMRNNKADGMPLVGEDLTQRSSIRKFGLPTSNRSRALLAKCEPVVCDEALWTGF